MSDYFITRKKERKKVEWCNAMFNGGGGGHRPEPNPLPKKNFP